MTNITIHAEVEGGESVEAYKGESIANAQTFVNGLTSVTVIQCNLSNTLTNGEGRSMARKEKDDMAPVLLADIKSWLDENG